MNHDFLPSSSTKAKVRHHVLDGFPGASVCFLHRSQRLPLWAQQWDSFLQKVSISLTPPGIKALWLEGVVHVRIFERGGHEEVIRGKNLEVIFCVRGMDEVTKS